MANKCAITMTVNGKQYHSEVEPRMLLVHYLRDALDLTGTHIGCDTSREKHGLQCGFCTPGMIMASYQLLKNNPNPTEAEIRKGLEGNICRCTGYQNIVRAVQHAAEQMRTAATAPVGAGE